MAKYLIKKSSGNAQEGPRFFAYDSFGKYIPNTSSLTLEDCEQKLKESLKTKNSIEIVKELEL